MILDKALIDQAHPLGKIIMEKAKLKAAPKNIDELYSFLKAFKQSAEENNDAAALICQILFSFVTSEKVRDRHTSPREFEDIFGALFGTISTDTTHRSNPIVPKTILAYDKLTDKENWNISSDLSGNKREKADINFGDYKLSLKTLKGKSISNKGVIINRKFNNEINVGSFSFRALFKGILSDKQLEILRDRKGGLGSGRQIRENVLNPIKESNKCLEFSKRLRDFLEYVYSEDILILIKSNYQITFYLIPSSSFVESICFLYEKDETNFQNVWYRWENNNLRLPLNAFLRNLEKYNQKIYKLSIDLSVFESNKTVQEFNASITEAIKENLKIFQE